MGGRKRTGRETVTWRHASNKRECSSGKCGEQGRMQRADARQGTDQGPGLPTRHAVPDPGREPKWLSGCAQARTFSASRGSGAVPSDALGQPATLAVPGFRLAWASRFLSRALTLPHSGELRGLRVGRRPSSPSSFLQPKLRRRSVATELLT